MSVSTVLASISAALGPLKRVAGVQGGKVVALHRERSLLWKCTHGVNVDADELRAQGLVPFKNGGAGGFGPDGAKALHRIYGLPASMVENTPRRPVQTPSALCGPAKTRPRSSRARRATAVRSAQRRTASRGDPSSDSEPEPPLKRPPGLSLAELAQRQGTSELRMKRLLTPFIAAGLVEAANGDVWLRDGQFARCFRECSTGIPLEPGDATGLERTARDSRGGKERHAA